MRKHVILVTFRITQNACSSYKQIGNPWSSLLSTANKFIMPCTCILRSRQNPQHRSTESFKLPVLLAQSIATVSKRNYHEVPFSSAQQRSQRGIRTNNRGHCKRRSSQLSPSCCKLYITKTICKQNIYCSHATIILINSISLYSMTCHHML